MPKHEISSVLSRPGAVVCVQQDAGVRRRMRRSATCSAAMQNIVLEDHTPERILLPSNYDT
jgi:hypothetical protein